MFFTIILLLKVMFVVAKSRKDAGLYSTLSKGLPAVHPPSIMMSEKLYSVLR